MSSNSAHRSDAHPERMVKLSPGGAQSLAHLSDSEVLEGTRRLVGRSNQLLAALLVHLGEVEARGLHRTRACTSLYTYCIYELRFSEDEAARRAGAAKVVKKFPLAFDAVANGELHLTGLLMLGPHLTAENCGNVLARAKFRTKKEIGKLVRELAPLPQVPDVMEPLGPEPKPIRNPTWEEFVASLGPPVRELRPGERPKDWANDGGEDSCAPDAAHAQAGGELDQAVVPAPERVDLPPLTAPQQYHVQFSALQEHVELVERAKRLLAREAPGIGLAELHLQAMRLFVAALEKEKGRASPARQRRARQAKPTEVATTAVASERAVQEPAEMPPAMRSARSRYVPVAVRRTVIDRDEARCTYVDERGVRCCEAHFLELHHLTPFASGGENVAENLTLRCAAHNALAAEDDFGRERILEARHRARHESLRRTLETARKLE
jgi:hypothetical protein